MGDPPLYVTFSVTFSSIPCPSYIRKCTSCDHNFSYAFVKWWYLKGFFFQFFKIFIFQAANGVRGQKMVQNNKKFYPLLTISQEPYIIWLLFMVHICKMIISPGNFFFFFFHFYKILVLWIVSGVKKEKLPKMTKNYVHCAPYLRNHTSYDCHLWYTCVKWWYL